MMLAYTRPFSGDLENAKQGPQCEITEMKAVFADGVLVLAAHIKGSPRIYGIAAYNDPVRYEADYDAVGWTCRPDSKGDFRLEIGELQTGKYQIRLLACHVNGAKSRFSYDYEVDADGKLPTEMFEYPALLKKAVKAYQNSNRRRLMAAISTLERRYGHIEIVKKKAACLRRLSQPRKLHSARTIPARVKRIDLSRIECTHASVGWENPMRDQVPIGGDKGCFLQVGGEVFTSGFYAHAPSSFKFELGGKWKSLSFGYGLQDGYGGSVVFVIHSDGKEAYRSPAVHGHRSHKSEIDVTGVGVLELVVEDGANGNNSDWGVWLEPVLTR